MIRIFKNFSDRARKLRSFYDQVYESPSDPRRFSWDLWNVPGQYHLMRTPATHFFPKSLIQPFMEDLVSWGRKNLGCHTISPLWLSAYTEGCEQKFHVDQPHGPWAFVYSLSPRNIKFGGGNTLLVKDSILDHWSPKPKTKRFEMNEIFHSIAPHFNQLLVFDGRIPHGVERVTKVSDMRDARLVLHGWFLPPRPFIQGAHSPRQAAQFLKTFLAAMQSEGLFSDGGQGFLCFEFRVSRTGEISRERILSTTLQAPRAAQATLKKDLARSLKLLSSLRFDPARGRGQGTRVTLPIEVG